jgi:hypothetical protein
VVLLLAFLNYYQVRADRVSLGLAAGFCLYSCLIVADNSILERWFKQYDGYWNLLWNGAFVGSLTLWSLVLRKPVPQRASHPDLLPWAVYKQMSPEINGRLRGLNEQLSQWWRPEPPRP